MKLWIDDIRPAPDGYVWCTSVNCAKYYIVHGVNDDTNYQLETRTTLKGAAAGSTIPARKGEKVRFYYDIAGTKNFRFIYAEGSK